MKIIHWNCQGAFRKKQERILALKPDLLIISECESEERLQFGKLTPQPNQFYWYGDNVHKGVGIFSYSDLRFELRADFNPKFRYILPFTVNSPSQIFDLYAIWAMGDMANRKERYVGQIWLAMNYYKNHLTKPSILIGDFNSNQIWDKKSRVGNHTDVVNLLNQYEIESLYHKRTKIDFGKEEEPTFYLYRKAERPYHMDYCFCSKQLTKNGFQFDIGTFKDWLDLSDHSPIITIL